MLSLRNQSWIIKIDYANGQGTGNVIWRLGYQGEFTLLDSTSPADWFFAQHFATFVDSKSTGSFQLSVFDNGNNRFPDFTGHICPSTVGEAQYTWPTFFGLHVPDCYSRPAVFGVNEDRRTARLLWSHVAPYSYWGGVSMETQGKRMFVDISSPSDQIVRIDKLKRPLMKTAIEEGVIISLVLLLFFWPIPSAFAPLTAIPIFVIVASVPVLGGIAVAIGLLIDAIVLMFGQGQSKKTEHEKEAGQAGVVSSELMSTLKRISRPSFFALVAIAISFLPMFSPQDRLDAQIEEVTRQHPTQPVWELYVSGQESYRTVYLPSLYPEVQW
jgi:hypothetical protein